MNADQRPFRQYRGPEAGSLIAVLLTVLLWAASYPAISLALTGFPPFALAALRYTLASAVLIWVGYLAGIGLPPSRDLPRVAATGALGISAYNLLLNLGQTTVSPSITVLLISVSPVMAAVLGYALLAERLRPLGWAAIAVSFLGAAIIALTRNAGEVRVGFGAVLILAAAFCFALQWILQKRLLANHRPIAVSIWVICAGTMLLLPFLPQALASVPHSTAQALAAVLFLALGPAAIAYVLWAYALAHYPVSRATSFLYLVAPVSLLMSYFLFGEAPAPSTLVGGAFAIGGVILLNTLGRMPASQASAGLP